MCGKHNTKGQEEQEWIENLRVGEEPFCHGREGCLAPIDLSSHVDCSSGKEKKKLESLNKQQFGGKPSAKGFAAYNVLGTQDMGDPPCGNTGLDSLLLDPDLVSIMARML